MSDHVGKYSPESTTQALKIRSDAYLAIGDKTEAEHALLKDAKMLAADTPQMRKEVLDQVKQFNQAKSDGACVPNITIDVTHDAGAKAKAPTVSISSEFECIVKAGVTSSSDGSGSSGSARPRAVPNELSEKKNN